jgi:hypothetical protein
MAVPLQLESKLPADVKNMAGYDNISLKIRTNISDVTKLSFSAILLDHQFSSDWGTGTYLIQQIDVTELGSNWCDFNISLRNPSDGWYCGNSNSTLTDVSGIWFSLSSDGASTASGSIDIDLIGLNDGPTCDIVVPGDMNADCKIDFVDYALLADTWVIN